MLKVENVTKYYGDFKAVDNLFDSILKLKTRDECYDFFEDLCTISEILSMAQRFEVAKMLREQRTYLEIAEKTGASTATISRVNRCLNYGTDGYSLILDRLDAENDDSVIASITKSEFPELVEKGIVQGGMLPKLENSFAAIDAGVNSVIITKADNIDNPNAGTKLSK